MLAVGEHEAAIAAGRQVVDKCCTQASWLALSRVTPYCQRTSSSVCGTQLEVVEGRMAIPRNPPGRSG